MTNALRLSRIIIFIIFGAIILIYSIFQAWKLISGPVVKISNPIDGTTFKQALIEISGETRNISYIHLNDKPIFTDKDGNFNEKFLLSPGYNVIKIDASDKFKKRIEKRLELVLKEYQ